jgi:uncharacterized membrane protein
VTRSIIVRAAFIVLLALYPVFIYFGLRILPPGFLGLVLAVLLLMRFGIVRPKERAMALPVIGILFTYAVASALIGSTQMLLFYPVLVNSILFVIFAGSLSTKDPLLLRFVRARGHPINAHTPRYLTRLTAVWAGFFVINGMIAVWTTTVSVEIWTIYNGMISYILVAILATGEWVFRRHYKKRLGISGS